MTMRNYFKDEKGVLRCVEGELPLDKQKYCRTLIEQEANMRVKSAVLALVVDNPPKVDEPMLA